MKSRRLENKIALITGGTKSIGLAIAKAFCDEGAQVLITGRRPYKEGKKIADSLPNTLYISLDVAEETQWEEAIAHIKASFDRLDILVNNAGIDSIPTHPQNPEHCSLEDWRKIHATNLDGTFLGIKYAMPLLKKSNNASIINMGSRSGLIGVPVCAAYASSKAAISNYTKTVATYCAEQRYLIRCNDIQPAAILTDMWDFGHDDKTDQRVKDYSKKIPAGRMGKPSEVAAFAVFLASDDSLFINGSSHLIDGGIMASAGSYQATNEISDEKEEHKSVSKITMF